MPSTGRTVTDQPLSDTPLHRPRDEHDGCGVGFIADIDGRRRANVLPAGLHALESLQHRGAAGADAKTGDGAGVLFSLPRRPFAEHLAECTGHSPDGPVGVGMFFWRRSRPAEQRRGHRLIAGVLERRGIEHFCWRQVPTRPDTLGVKASESRPHIEQLVVGFGADVRERCSLPSAVIRSWNHW